MAAGVSTGCEFRWTIGTLTKMGNITSISDGPSNEALDMTTLDDEQMTYVASVFDAGEVTLELNYDEADSQQAALFADLKSGAIRAGRLDWPSGNTLAFSGFITNLSRGATVKQKKTLSATIKLTGDTTFT